MNMGLFDFFRKGKEVRKQPEAAPVTEEHDAKTSLLDLQNRPDRPAAPLPKYYEIQKGDSLSAIAKRQYGDVGKWKILYEANKDLIDDPDLIYPGQRIRIPKEE